MRSRVVVLTSLLLCAASLTACGSASDVAPTVSQQAPPAPDLTGSLVQYREDEVAHVLKVELTNHGAGTVTVDTLRVAWPGLSGTDAVTVDYPVPPGVTVALKVPYGDAVCTSPTRPADPVTAVLTTSDADITLPITATDVLLEKVWDEDCARQRLLGAVDVAFGTRWTATTQDGAPVLRGDLVLTRRASTAAIRVVDLDGSVLLTLDGTPPVRAPLLTMPADAPTASLSVDVGSTLRCDGHSLGESKKTYVFDVGLDLGDGRVDLTLQPPDDVKAQMYDVIRRACHV